STPPPSVPPAAPAVVPPVIPPAPFVAQPSPVALAVSTVFNRTLQIGVSGEDIRRLQELLNSDPETLVAVSGVGSPGNETDFFGNLTRRAVGKFQLKYSVIVSEEDNGYGIVGPRTRTKLVEVFSGQTALVPIPESQTASVAILQAELRQLLEQLAILLQTQLRSLTGQ
ncbi:MAG: peptidoglycan-binding protein, partial [Candidatus Vogelbacteria bacterium]|nr:peptidoglycan-binding protein [Candidatus Vogelbacteria bacterium]